MRFLCGFPFSVDQTKNRQKAFHWNRKWRFSTVFWLITWFSAKDQLNSCNYFDLSCVKLEYRTATLTFYLNLIKSHSSFVRLRFENCSTRSRKIVFDLHKWIQNVSLFSLFYCESFKESLPTEIPAAQSRIDLINRRSIDLSTKCHLNMNRNILNSELIGILLFWLNWIYFTAKQLIRPLPMGNTSTWSRVNRKKPKSNKVNKHMT